MDKFLEKVINIVRVVPGVPCLIDSIRGIDNKEKQTSKVAEISREGDIHSLIVGQLDEIGRTGQ